MNLSALISSVPVVLAAAIFVLGVSTIFIRRKAAWSLVGQITALKAVAATALLLSQYKLEGAGDLAMISLVAMGLVPMAGLTGLLVLHRCGRFGGTLDYDEEDSLRN